MTTQPVLSSSVVMMKMMNNNLHHNDYIILYQLTLTLEMNTATKTVLRTTPTHTIIFHLLKTRRLVSNHSLCHDYCLNESMLNLGCLKQPFLKRLIFLQRLEIP